MGAEKKTSFVAGVSIDEQAHPIAMNMNVVDGLRSKEIARWAKRHLMRNCLVVADGFPCFNAVTEAVVDMNRL